MHEGQHLGERRVGYQAVSYCGGGNGGTRTGQLCTTWVCSLVAQERKVKSLCFAHTPWDSHSHRSSAPRGLQGLPCPGGMRARVPWGVQAGDASSGFLHRDPPGQGAGREESFGWEVGTRTCWGVQLRRESACLGNLHTWPYRSPEACWDNHGASAVSFSWPHKIRQN